MTPKLVFSVGAAVTGVLGLAYLAAPALMLGSVGISPEQATVYMTRRYGAALLGYSAVLWFARAAAASPARHAIAVGGFVVTALLAVLSLAGVLGGTVGPAAWRSVVFEALLAAGFGYLLVTEKP